MKSNNNQKQIEEQEVHKIQQQNAITNDDNAK